MMCGDPSTAKSQLLRFDFCELRTHFRPKILILYTLKTSESQRLFLYYQGVYKETSNMKWVKLLWVVPVVKIQGSLPRRV